METFSALLSFCAGNSLVTGEFPSQRPLTRGLDAFFDLRLNKRLSKQLSRRWFVTPSRPLWYHCNETITWANVYPELCRHNALLGHSELNYMYYRPVSKLPVTLLISSWLNFFVENAKSEYIKGRWAPAANNVISIKCKNLGRHFRGVRQNPGTKYV